MNYSDWITAVVDLLQICQVTDPGFDPASATPTPDASFNAFYPTVIANTEIRLQRDLDLLGCYVTDSSASLTAHNRAFTLPTDAGTYQVVTQVSPIISSVKGPPLTPVSRDYLEQVYPSSATTGVPIYWCMVNQTSILVGPAPDQNYGVEVVGTQRLVPMSSSNPTNFISLNFPDIYLAASMVIWSAYQRDYGASADDPKLAISWEGQYQELLKSADIEEARKKFMSSGWQPRQPSPLATPPQN